jgi:hypothetical protein
LPHLAYEHGTKKFQRFKHPFIFCLLKHWYVKWLYVENTKHWLGIL